MDSCEEDKLYCHVSTHYRTGFTNSNIAKETPTTNPSSKYFQWVDVGKDGAQIGAHKRATATFMSLRPPFL